MFGGAGFNHTTLIVAVRIISGIKGERLVGVAYADTTDHVLGVTEFTDNDQLSELQVCF